MRSMKSPKIGALGGAATAAVTIAAVLAACSTVDNPDRARQFHTMMAASFHDRGIATVDRLKQDDIDARCSHYQRLGVPLPPGAERAFREASLKAVKWPSDGRLLGDWKAGEMLAQSGRGMTWTDKSADPLGNGGGCYNCHQLSGKEVAYGTIGPSLYRYASAHGVTDPAAPSARPALDAAWVKLYDSRAGNACSAMPRFGHAGLLEEQQLRDLMALLFDPASPVNQ